MCRVAIGVPSSWQHGACIDHLGRHHQEELWNEGDDDAKRKEHEGNGRNEEQLVDVRGRRGSHVRLPWCQLQLPTVEFLEEGAACKWPPKLGRSNASVFPAPASCSCSIALSPLLSFPCNLIPTALSGLPCFLPCCLGLGVILSRNRPMPVQLVHCAVAFAFASHKLHPLLHCIMLLCVNRPIEPSKRPRDPGSDNPSSASNSLTTPCSIPGLAQPYGYHMPPTSPT